jgi:hypothetical protein
MEKQQLSGYIMTGVGFVMILINALSYLLGWDLKSPAFTVLGLVLIVRHIRVGVKWYAVIRHFLQHECSGTANPGSNQTLIR